MTPNEFLDIIKAVEGVGGCEIRSQKQANVRLDKIETEKFPYVIVSQLMPSKETLRTDGVFDSVYTLDLMLLDHCKLDDEYQVKHDKQEALRTIIRQSIINANIVLQKVGKKINEFDILGLVDTQYDRNLIAANAIIKLPHTDLKQKKC